MVVNMRKRWKILLVVIAIGVLAGYLLSQAMKLPKPQKEFVAGTEAPDFTLKNQDGRDVILSQLRGTPVLLVFYRGYW